MNDVTTIPRQCDILAAMNDIDLPSIYGQIRTPHKVGMVLVDVSWRAQEVQWGVENTRPS